MHTVELNAEEALFLGLFRVALSEETPEGRLKAIGYVKHDVVTHQLELFEERAGKDWHKNPNNKPLTEWLAGTATDRHGALYEFAQVAGRYENRNERRLNIAEHVGKLAFLSIADGKFEGIQTPGGLIYQTGETGRQQGIRGARDLDTIRTSWMTYRGVVHLGIARDICEDQGLPDRDILPLAESIRSMLSDRCPKGTKNPYVPLEEQISFSYKSVS